MTAPKPPKPGSRMPFDPEAVLLNDAGLLLNIHFAKALFEELRRARGAPHAENALIQIGCLHGLRDAERANKKAFGSSGPAGAAASAPALAVELRGTPEFGTAGALEIHGTWPERTEATGRLSADGPAGAPACAVSAGYTSGWLSGILETDVVVLETRCSAAGDATCEFVAREAGEWLSRDEMRGRAVAEALPIVELRRALAELAADGASAVLSWTCASGLPPPPNALPVSFAVEARYTLRPNASFLDKRLRVATSRPGSPQRLQCTACVVIGPIGFRRDFDRRCSGGRTPCDLGQEPPDPS